MNSKIEIAHSSRPTDPQRSTGRPRRWPAYAVAVLFLVYAAGKAAFALQARLGFPGGPVVSAADHERYAREFMDVATWHSGSRPRPEC